MGPGLAENDNKSVTYDHIGVIGAGAWGTALAMVAAEAGRRVTLWARESGLAAEMAANRENKAYLPGAQLVSAITPTAELGAAAAADAVLLASPAQYLRGVLESAAPLFRSGTPAVLCAKGIERGSGKLMTEVLGECAPAVEPAILSGPSFADDVAKHLPTAITVAAARMETAETLQATLGCAQFRPYASDDLVGVALGGAAKNVYAIACGIVMGLGLGESARAALLARGFAELCRLGAALGARNETLMGLSGLGDLVLTATGPASRNFRFGHAVGSGKPQAEFGALAEGAYTAPALIMRARRHGIELPIAEAVSEILEGTLTLKDAVPRLMMRPLKAE